jgi:nitrogen regulatory protein P-II 2
VTALSLRKVSIVAEALLEDRIIRICREAGARGHTVTEARGEGSRGVRASEWEGKNVKIETIVDPVVAELILGRVAEEYFEHYAVIAYVTEVSVLRGEKYASVD